jgi:serine/threonine protein phosphatase 1
MKVVAGHIGTASISGDKDFHGIYHDGSSHYYIDGSVYDSGTINVLLVDTDKDKYYSVTADGESEIVPYK